MVDLLYFLLIISIVALKNAYTTFKKVTDLYCERYVTFRLVTYIRLIRNCFVLGCQPKLKILTANGELHVRKNLGLF